MQVWDQRVGVGPVASNNHTSRAFALVQFQQAFRNIGVVAVFFLLHAPVEVVRSGTRDTAAMACTCPLSMELSCTSRNPRRSPGEFLNAKGSYSEKAGARSIAHGAMHQTELIMERNEFPNQR
jgi:hypothetical protein